MCGSDSGHSYTQPALMLTVDVVVIKKSTSVCNNFNTSVALWEVYAGADGNFTLVEEQPPWQAFETQTSLRQLGVL